MKALRPGEVTSLLRAWGGGSEAALSELLPFVYDELRRLAHLHLSRERQDHTLSTTALVHEAYLNLAGEDGLALHDRAHFFAIASRVMRRVLIWYARKRNTAKRGAGMRHIKLDQAPVFSDEKADALLELSQLLEQLEAVDERMCRVVEYRYFGGMTVQETAKLLAVSPATVKRDWQTARAWLRREMKAA